MRRRAARAVRGWLLAGVLAAVGSPLVAQLPASPPPRVKDSMRASPGKPQAPLAVEHRLSAAPEVARPLVVTITARGGRPVEALALDVRGTEGLAVSPPVAVATAAAGTRAWEVRVTPWVAGAHRLNVLVSGAGDSGPIARSVVVPIDTVGRSAVADPLDSSGERLIALPATKRDAEGGDERKPR